ncbi:MAG TPA: type II toxin-antitoxin system VapB family antitoxin [Caulobacteraceae bacterium]|nr:type II toxin-antitoxin system VapB family antitoxin [Caulobacteraceae bacterium]
MKTTIDIADGLLEEARRAAAREGVTLRAVVERGLREVLSRGTTTAPFKVRPVTFKGEGLRPELRGRTWAEILDVSYESPGD